MSDGTIPSERIVSALEDRRLFMVLMMVASAIVLIYTELSGMWGDLDHYYVNAGDVLDGKMPYSESQFEYPPFALVFMLIPRLLSWNLESFHFACAILAYVFIILGSHVLLKMADEFIGSRWQTHLILISLVVFGAYFVIARYDIYPAVMAAIAIWLYMRRSYVPAFFVLALAAMTKLYPAVFLIPMILPMLMNREWKDAGKSLAVFAVTCLIVELPFILADPSTAFDYLSYHSDRGIQIESVASGLFLVYYLFVPSDIGVEFNYGSDNLTGWAPDALAPWMNVITAVVLLAFIAMMVVRMRGRDMDPGKTTAVMCAMCAAMLLLMIMCSKVYSAQYYIWIILVLPFTQVACLSPRHRREIAVLLVLFGFFTMCSYLGYLYLKLDLLYTVPIILLAIKNLFHILLVWELVHLCWFETGGSVEDKGAFELLSRRRMARGSGE